MELYNEDRIDSISHFFTTEEWDDMPDYQQFVEHNRIGNYRKLLSLGIRAQPPEFVLRYEQRKKKLEEKAKLKQEKERAAAASKLQNETEAMETDENEDQCDPKPNVFEISLKEILCLPHPVLDMNYPGDFVIKDEIIRESRVKSFHEQNEGWRILVLIGSKNTMGFERILKFLKEVERITMSKVILKNSETVEIPKNERSRPAMCCVTNFGNNFQNRYPKRLTKPVDYVDKEIPDDDEFIWCDKCNREFYPACQEHGPLVHISDTEIPKDENDPLRADKTIPGSLKIAMSRIPGAGKGVFSLNEIPAGTLFGPYEGNPTEDDISTGYSWMIHGNARRPMGHIDASNPGISNWMRYVNCSRHNSEQNLIAFQYKGSIYYRTSRIILPETELLVYYGNDYAAGLGIDYKNYQTPLQSPLEYRSEGVFPCKFCKIHLTSEKYLISHIKHCRKRSEIQEGVRVISDQNMSLNALNSADNVNGNKTFTCQYCKIGYSSEVYLIKHLRHCRKKADIEAMNARMNRDQNIVTSTISENTSETINSLNNPNTCNICKITFISQEHLNDHFKIECHENSYKCCVCHEKFADKTELLDHLPIHTNRKPLKDSDNFVLKSDENRFNINNKYEQQFCCKICQKNFTQNADLVEHQRIHSDKTQSENFKYRIKTHTNEKSFQCDICMKKFTASKGLTYHMRTHTNEKPYQCDVCMKRFTRSDSLTKHMRTHTNEKPFQCDVCMKKFTESSSLTKHIRTHTNEKPYQCDVCMKKFTESSNLTSHMRTHTNEKPFQCDICMKRFTESGNLTKHMRTHTIEKPYQCDVCMKRFTVSSSLTSHMRTHKIEI